MAFAMNICLSRIYLETVPANDDPLLTTYCQLTQHIFPPSSASSMSNAFYWWMAVIKWRRSLASLRVYYCKEMLIYYSHWRLSLIRIGFCTYLRFHSIIACFHCCPALHSKVTVSLCSSTSDCSVTYTKPTTADKSRSAQVVDWLQVNCCDPMTERVLGWLAGWLATNQLPPSCRQSHRSSVRGVFSGAL